MCFDSSVCLNISFLTPPAVSPPENVKATQTKASASVEVSWSHPSDGVTISGYKIFYGKGKNVSVSSSITGILLALNGDSVGEIVSLCSVANQLSSVPINVTITGELKINTYNFCERVYMCIVTLIHLLGSLSTCTVEIGATVGVAILLVCLLSVLIMTVTLFLHKRR